MRLGTSGLGVIAVVSLLVTAAAERDDSGGVNRGNGIDNSRSTGSERTLTTRYPPPSQLATETSSDSSSSSSFVNIEFESLGSTSPGASRLPPRSSVVLAPQLTDRRAEIPTTLARFPTEFPTSRRRLAGPRNFKNPAAAAAAESPDVRSENDNTQTTLEGVDEGSSPEVDSRIPAAGSASSDLEEKLVSDEPTLPSSASGRRRRRRRGRSETTTSPSRRIESRDSNDDRRSAWSIDEATETNSSTETTSSAESAGTMSRRRPATMTPTTTTTTTTTVRRRLLDEYFRNATERHEGKAARDTRESSRNKETTEANNNGQPHFRNSRGEANAVPKSSERTMSGEANDAALHSESRYPANYSVGLGTAVHFRLENADGEKGSQGGQAEQPSAKRLTADRTTDLTGNHRPREFVSGGKTLRNVDAAVNAVNFGLENADDETQGQVEQPSAKRLMADQTTDSAGNHRSREFVSGVKTPRNVDTAVNALGAEVSLARHETTMEQVLTMRSMPEVLARKPETLGYTSVTEEIARAREITSESSLETPTIERPLLRLPVNTGNTSEIDVTAAALDNHKVARVRSYQTVRTEQEQQQQGTVSLAAPSLPARLPHGIAVKDTADTKDAITGLGIERPAVLPENQLAIPKSAYAVAKNTSNPTINLVDGKPRKKYYEIKPSLITETDRGMNLDVTTTPRRTFDKFLLPSVPSAFGKFGPFFLDEEDRRNVTERIGNTVQLDCRIGMLGHRKVTWLQHYKDSFRLLTVERESYSVDRRISLNFQYPDNWRLQIAYASLRDSGLYKCQVEIDQDRSLVKRYNVIITAPTLTITDDSGRPVSGERHLKAGSALKLRCEARDVIQRLNESVLWMRGDATLTQDVSENRTTEIVNEKEINVVVSTLLVEGATPKHAGNYSCVVPEKARTTIAVHVLNGELPAAVQHNSGVSTAVLNLWVIHLTASYGFFR